MIKKSFNKNVFFKLFFVFLFLILNPRCNYFSGQSSDPKEGEPLWIIQNLFSPSGFSQKDKYLCCELEKDKTNEKFMGGSIPPEVKRSYELITQNETDAVVSVNLIDDKQKSEDWYFYLEKKEGVWKVRALRSLAMPGFFMELIQEDDKMSPEQRKKMIQEFPDYKSTLQNAKMIIKSDQELIYYFKDKKTEFESLLNEYKKEFPDSANFSKDLNVFQGLSSWPVNPDSSVLKEKLKNLLLTSIGIQKEYPNCYFLQIGGMLDNSAGYLYVEDPKNLPSISSETFIIIKPIGGGWYLYKTT